MLLIMTYFLSHNYLVAVATAAPNFHYDDVALLATPKQRIST